MSQDEIDSLESAGHIDTIPQLLKFIERYDDRIAISNKQFKKTYKELLTDIGKTRSFLIKQQIKQNDIVALQMNNEYLFAVIFLAITSLGATADVFPSQMPINLVQAIYSHHKIKLLIYSDSLKNNYVNFPFNTINANNAIDNQLAPSIEVNSNNLAALYFTGGTIGRPKAVMMSHKNLMRGMTNGAFGFKRILYIKYLTIIPFFHIFGLVRNLLTPLFTGSENYLCEDFKSFLPNLSLVNPNIVCITPTLLEMICHFGKQNIKSIGTGLETIVVGGATVSSHLMKQANELKLYTCQGYGLTETANLVCGNRFPNEYPTSVGQIYDFQEIKIINDEL
jgi:long-subunit acyl-CoA synthetase (AMP-forming)